MTQPWNKLTERERDALVAEKVMGYRWFAFKNWKTLKSDYFQQLLSNPEAKWIKRHNGARLEGKDTNLEDFSDVPKYSTDISAAMEVVQTLNRNTPFQHYKIESDNIPDENNRWFWSVSIGSPERGYLKEYGDTLPEAICLAALRAKGIEV